MIAGITGAWATSVGSADPATRSRSGGPIHGQRENLHARDRRAAEAHAGGAGAGPGRATEVATDRNGEARFAADGESGKVLVSGIERNRGRLDGDIQIGLWSITEPEDRSAGNLGEFPSGSNACADMETRTMAGDGRRVETDSHGYLVNLGRHFPEAQADWATLCARLDGILSSHELLLDGCDSLLIEREAQRLAGLLLARQGAAPATTAPIR